MQNSRRVIMRVSLRNVGSDERRIVKADTIVRKSDLARLDLSGSKLYLDLSPTVFTAITR